MSTQVPHVYRVAVERGVPARMRDGTVLRADVYRPDAPGRFPVLLIRGPYGHDEVGRDYAERFVPLGYCVVMQDGRDRFKSEGPGPYYPLVHEALDGYDTVEWSARLPWSNGMVGTVGQSYMAATQMLLTPTRPPHLRAAFPVSSPSAWNECWAYRTGGALEWGWLLSYVLYMVPEELRRQGRDEEWRSLEQCLKNPGPEGLLGEISAESYLHLPLSDWGERLRSIAPYVADYLEHADDGPYWWSLDLRRRWQDVRTPMFHVTSWFDGFQEGALAAFDGIRQMADEATASAQKLLIGPWSHLYRYSDPTTGHTGEIDFGAESAIRLHDLEQRWFDYWLKGISTGVLEAPPITLFVTGDNVWRDEYEWPLARTRYTDFFLHSHGDANTQDGDGTLSPVAPGDEPFDSYVYDPRAPVPSLGGNSCLSPHLDTNVVGVRDQRPVRGRADVLVYTSAVLNAVLEITGPVSVELFVASSAEDTDFTAKLVDVAPDGYAANIQQGILRARYRESRSVPRPLTPGEATRVEIDLWATSYVFRPGHRISVEISSSNFPLFDRHPNVYAPLHTVRSEQLVKARQTVFHDTQRPSRIVLPVIPR